MSKRSSSGNKPRAKQDRRNESQWYRPLMFVVAAVMVFGAYKLLSPAVLGVDIRIEPALTGVFVSHERVLIMPAEDLMIPYYTITGVELLPSRPDLKKIHGLDGLRTLIGKFQSSFGEVQVYAFNYRDPSTRFVKIETAETTYILTPADAENFVGVVRSQMKR